MTFTPRWQHRSPAHPGRAAAARSVIAVHAPVPGAGHPHRHNGRPDMKIKIRPDDSSMLQDNDWLQADGWLAELRDDGGADPVGDRHTRPARGSDPWPEVLAEADARARAEAAARVEAAAGTEMTERAVIGDQLRMPIMWCEMGSCISWHADPAALGEADARARAIGADWRIDACGRLVCPRCQQTDPGFWATGPVVLWDRYTAVAGAARAVAVHGDGTAAAWGGSRDPGLAAGGYLPVGLPEPGWHR